MINGLPARDRDGRGEAARDAGLVAMGGRVRLMTDRSRVRGRASAVGRTCTWLGRFVAYDPREKLWDPPMRLLFQHRVGGLRP
ncbi:hypothetical protein ABIA33_007097 [Streptacidiphilus sp. MAP12-16]